MTQTADSPGLYGSPAVKHVTTVLILGSLLVILAGGLLLVFGQVSGVEFSPDEVCHRSFHVYRVGGVEIGPRTTSRWQTDLERYLQQRGLVTPSPYRQARWHLVHERRRGRALTTGKAAQMCRELECFTGESATWVAWSRQHPDIAAKLWPEVIAMARETEYDRVADALLAAELAESPEQFDKLLREFAQAPPGR